MLDSEKKLHNPLLVVGIGASAGGIKACQELLETLPLGNIAYIFCQHLSPHHESHLQDILQKNTDLTVRLVQQSLPLEPNHFYIPQPGRNIEIIDNFLQVLPAKNGHSPAPNIDRLFSSLALHKGVDSIAIILSGSGSDGSKGVMDIKREKGLVLVQSPESCQHESMPVAAITTKQTDLIATPSEIGKCLQRLLNVDLDEAITLPEKSFNDALNQINKITGVNFNNYRKNTIQRRLVRRMHILNMTSIEDYLNLLNNNPDEAHQFIQSAVIVVSEFYRDKIEFKGFQDHLNEVLSKKITGDELRIWVCGCASGEEAYTIALMIEESLDKIRKRIPYKLLATDISDHALSVARASLYKKEKLKNLPQAWLQRYFTKEGDHYLVKSRIRENIIFSQHEILSTPPFSNIDIVTCRNLLIYFNKHSQEMVLSKLAYALNPDGTLFLGASENVKNNRYFSTIDEKNKLYKRNDTAVKELVFSTRSSYSTETSTKTRSSSDTKEFKLYKSLFEQVSNVIFVVNSENQIIYKSGDYPKILSDTGGMINNDLFHLLDHWLRPEVRAILYKARQAQKEVRSIISTNSDNTQNNAPPKASYLVKAVALRDNLFGLSAIMFHSVEDFFTKTPEGDDDALRILDSELHHARENLQVLIEELESSNEQLQVQNEELQSTNEEYQSTNEELQTVNEELQSTNEELTTINEENNEKAILFLQLNNDLTNIQESIHLPLILIDKKYRIQRFTSHCKNVLNTGDLKLHDLIFAIEWYHDIEVIKSLIEKVKRSKLPEKTTVNIQDKYYEIQVSPALDEKAKFTGYIIVFFDISDSYITHKKLRNEKNIASRMLETIMEGVIRIDKNLQVEYANQISESICGFEPNTMKTMPVSYALNLFTVERKVFPIEKHIKTAINNKEQLSMIDKPLMLTSRENKEFFIELSFSPTYEEQDDISSGGIIAFRDVTEKYQKMHELIWNGTHDSLTELINRGEMERRLGNALDSAKRHKTTSSLFFMDLDQFKVVNDVCGHQAGDLLLKQVSELMKTKLRTRDTLARFGGDEFAVLLDKCQIEEALSVADKLRDAIEQYRFSWNKKIFTIGVSIGIAEITDQCHDVSELLLKADSACYLAKEAGKNTIQIHHENNEEMEEKRLHLDAIADINEALDKNGFLVYLQKIHSLKNAGTESWEVLVRMYHPRKRQFLLPDSFLPAAERFNLAHKIDLWVLQHALSSVSEIAQQQNKPMPSLHINVSGATLGSKIYIKTIPKLLKEYTIAPELICFELTESAAMIHYTQAEEFIQQIRSLGCKVALDDFGKGMSSLSYLNDLPLDIVKIDREFVKDIVEDKVKSEIVKSVRNVTKLLNLDLIAEGTETQEQSDHLASLDINKLQGFWYAKPISLEEFSAIAFTDN